MANLETFSAENTRQSRHTRADVVAAALQILDDYGLPDLTMRRLAATLDVQPSALYWHVPNKQTLLALIADEIVASRVTVGAVAAAGANGGDTDAGDTDAAATVDPAPDWKRATRAEATALRDGLLSYRDGAEVVSSSLALGLGGADASRRLADAIARGGFDPTVTEMAAAALLHFILGHVSHEQQRLQADSLGVVGAEHAASVGAIADLAGRHLTIVNERDSFDFGVALLLDGLAGLQTARQSASPAVNGGR
ncbi:MAG: TetR family transcriptional regulator [Microbacteriaceae bacterium]|nr:MAG: TetR family transcriptional regulator [Microbacteriaceae bacterium]